MDKYGFTKPVLTEPGTTFFLSQILKRCHTIKDTFHNTIINIGLFLLFVIVFVLILLYKYKGKTSIVEKHQKDLEKQQYILSKITKIQQAKRVAHQELITGLPNWENEFNKFNE